MIDQHKAIDWPSLEPGSTLLGVDSHGPVEVIASSQVAGTLSFNVVYRRSDGTTGIFVADERTANVSLIDKACRWTFDGDSALFRLVTEAQRIRDRKGLWRDRNYISLRDLNEDFARYPYLTRIKNEAVLTESVRGGIGKTTWDVETFASAHAGNIGGPEYMWGTADYLYAGTKRWLKGET